MRGRGARRKAEQLLWRTVDVQSAAPYVSVYPMRNCVGMGAGDVLLLGLRCRPSCGAVAISPTICARLAGCPHAMCASAGKRKRRSQVAMGATSCGAVARVVPADGLRFAALHAGTLTNEWSRRRPGPPLPLDRVAVFESPDRSRSVPFLNATDGIVAAEKVPGFSPDRNETLSSEPLPASHILDGPWESAARDFNLGFTARAAS
jgi:hypothetical protein